jgi:hypothetical protein
VPVIDPVATRIPVARGTLADLQTHLQAAANLELWTIPLYLTALASIQSDASVIPLPPERMGRTAPVTTTVTRLLVSVALQEMYHLQLAGNMARLFGVIPRLDWPVYEGQIPYVTELPAGVTVALGTVAEINTLRLMLVVETPDPSTTPIGPDAPDVPAFPFIQYDAAGQPCYPSIGTLYSVVLQLADRLRAHLDAGAPQIANGLFSAWYKHTGLIQPATLDEAINIIVDQGEGAIGHQDAPLDDPDAIPDQGSYDDPFFVENHFSHYERFQLALENGTNGVTVWPTGPRRPAPAQAHLSVIFSRLLDDLRAGWGGARPDLGPMFLFRGALARVYAAREVPAFAPLGAGSPSYEVGVAAVAPPEGATWAEHVQYFFALTDIAGMKANHVRSPDLGDQASVAASQDAIVAVTRNAQMPPGELNVWSDAQVTSFANWKRG